MCQLWEKIRDANFFYISIYVIEMNAIYLFIYVAVQSKNMHTIIYSLKIKVSCSE